MLISVVSLFVAGSAAAGRVVGETSVFVPSKDNNIYAADGGNAALLCAVATPQLCTSNGAGDAVALHNGVDGISMIQRRALIQFDFSQPISGNAITPGATITSAVLDMYVTNVSGQGNSTLLLKPLALSWGEGASSYVVVGFGGPGASEVAKQNDATWLHRFFNAASPGSSTPWGVGHAGGTCRPFTACTSAAASASATNLGVALVPITWNSVAMAQDVQSWVDTPASNFGWLIHAQPGTFPIALATRESIRPLPAFRPQLTVNFVPEPSSTIAALAAIGTLAGVARLRRRC